MFKIKLLNKRCNSKHPIRSLRKDIASQFQKWEGNKEEENGREVRNNRARIQRDIKFRFAATANLEYDFHCHDIPS